MPLPAFDISALVSWVTFAPLVGGLGLLGTHALARFLGLGGLPVGAWRACTLVIAAVTFLLSLGLWSGYDPTETGFQLVEYAPWLPELGIHYFVGIDGISLLLVLLTAFLIPIVLVATWYERASGARSFLFFVLALETGMIGAFVSLNLFQFYLFWELMLVPMYFIIGIWGGPRRIYAAMKFFLFTMFGSLLMLVAILVLYYLNFEQQGALGQEALLTLDFARPPGGGPALIDTLVARAGEDLWWKTQPYLFGAFAIAFAIKVPLVPFHTWLPDAHVEAPTAGSVVLAGVLLKMGAYGFVRFALPLFPAAAVEFTPLFFALSLVGILYGGLIAMVQEDVKKLVAYSSVAHLGFVMLGLFAFNVEGLEGSLLQMVHHGLATGALFLLVGMIYERRHTRRIDAFGGIAKPMPVFAALFGIVMMASIGLPSLGGFVGEFLILLGAFRASPWVGATATLGVVLAAAYMLWMYRRVMLGPVENPENRGLIDLGLRERAVVLALLVPIVWIGVYPQPFLSRLHPPVLELLHRLERHGAPPAESAESAGLAAELDEHRALIATRPGESGP